MSVGTCGCILSVPLKVIHDLDATDPWALALVPGPTPLPFLILPLVFELAPELTLLTPLLGLLI